MTQTLTHDGRLRAVTHALAQDLTYLLDDVEASLSTHWLESTAAVRHAFRRDAQHARQLLRNPRTPYGRETRGDRKRGHPQTRLLTSSPTTPAS
jgi:hypothetical protein